MTKTQIYSRKWYIKNKERRREYLAKKHYNLSPEQYRLIKSKQQCQICLTKEPGKKDFHIDHCHITGQVRGLLCHRCNRAMGLFNDDINLILKVKEYLENAPKTKE